MVLDDTEDLSEGQLEFLVETESRRRGVLGSDLEVFLPVLEKTLGHLDFVDHLLEALENLREAFPQDLEEGHLRWIDLLLDQATCAVEAVILGVEIQTLVGNVLRTRQVQVEVVQF